MLFQTKTDGSMWCPPHLCAINPSNEVWVPAYLPYDEHLLGSHVRETVNCHARPATVDILDAPYFMSGWMEDAGVV